MEAGALARVQKLLLGGIRILLGTLFHLRYVIQFPINASLAASTREIWINPFHLAVHVEPQQDEGDTDKQDKESSDRAGPCNGFTEIRFVFHSGSTLICC